MIILLQLAGASAVKIVEPGVTSYNGGGIDTLGLGESDNKSSCIAKCQLGTVFFDGLPLPDWPAKLKESKDSKVQ